MGFIRVRSVVPHEDSPVSSRSGTHRMGLYGSKDTMWPSYSKQDSYPSHKEHDHDEDADSMQYASVDEISRRMKELDEEREELQKAMDHAKEMEELHSQELEEKISAIFNDAVDIDADPPDTWKPYMEKGDIAGIISMESKELVDALKKRRPSKDIHKEITHLLAAIMKIDI